MQFNLRARFIPEENPTEEQASQLWDACQDIHGQLAGFLNIHEQGYPTDDDTIVLSMTIQKMFADFPRLSIAGFDALRYLAGICYSYGYWRGHTDHLTETTVREN